MKYSELVTQIKTLDLPSVYHHWGDGNAPSLPYIVHYKSGRDDMGADNINFKKQQGVALELYTDIPDFINEEKIETLLDSLGLFYQTDEATFIEEQTMFVKRYEFTLRKDI